MTPLAGSVKVQGSLQPRSRPKSETGKRSTTRARTSPSRALASSDTAADQDEALKARPRRSRSSGCANKKERGPPEREGSPPKTRRLLRGGASPAPAGGLRQQLLLAATCAKPLNAEAALEFPGGEASEPGAPAGASASVPPAGEGPPKDPGGPWRDLCVPPEELRPSACLTTGAKVSSAVQQQQSRVMYSAAAAKATRTAASLSICV